MLCAGRGGRVPGSSEPGRRSGHGGPAGPAALPTGTCRFRLGIATGAAVASGPRSDCPAARQPQPPHAGASGKGALRGEHAGRGTDADLAATSTWSPDCLSPSLQATHAPSTEGLRPGARASALLASRSGRLLALLGVDPHAPSAQWGTFILSVKWKCVVGIPSKRRGPCCRLGRGSAQGPRGMTGTGIEGDRLGRCPVVRSRSREGAAGQLPAARSDCSPSARAV